MLSDSERIDVLKFISKTHRDIHENRIKRELQVVITTLSFYAACVVFLYNYRCIIDIKNNYNYQFAICVAFTIVAIYVYIYLKSSGKSNNFNQALSELSEEILSRSLTIDPKCELKNEFCKFYDDPKKYIKEYEKKKVESHPSAERWQWQIIIVLCGGGISLYLSLGLVNTLMGVFFSIILWRIIIYIYSYLSLY